ncbi:MAG TPA: GntR family transcriptional regulator [Gemmatimonadales bacterium]|nr:GntR family transcriptional regulator [Gemmatimonadales bacterium]
MPLLIRIDPEDDRAIYVQIMDEIRRAVLLGGLTAGEALPSVREVAAEVRVNPNTVRQAYRELQREGLLGTRRGVGSFVREDANLDDGQREAARRRVARRVLRDAYRHGLNLDELITLLREVAAPREAGGSG